MASLRSVEPVAGRAPPPPDISPEARAILADRPVVDCHVDAIGRALDLGDDLAERGRGHFDLVRAAEGGLGAWVVVCWVDPELYLERSFDRAGEMLAAAHGLARARPGRFRLVGDTPGLAAARESGCIAGIAGIEGGHAIEGSLEKLSWLFERGLRVMTLVWNNHLPWVRSCREGAGAGVPAGLSDFGRRVVAEMNQLGVVVDLSHAGERSFYDALEASSKPVLASHSGCAALHDYPRNLTDDQLRALAAQGGVVGIVFHPGFLDAGARAEEARVRASPCYKDIAEPDPARRFLKQQAILRSQARPFPAERLVDHVVHAAEVAGVEHVGLGSDYDGIERGPQWMEDARGYAVLCELLLRRGFAADEVRAILGGNAERVLGEVTGPGTLAHGRAIAPLSASGRLPGGRRTAGSRGR